jgi:hypothetical protein
MCVCAIYVILGKALVAATWRTRGLDGPVSTYILLGLYSSFVIMIIWGVPSSYSPIYAESIYWDSSCCTGLPIAIVSPVTQVYHIQPVKPG